MSMINYKIYFSFFLAIFIFSNCSENQNKKIDNRLIPFFEDLDNCLLKSEKKYIDSCNDIACWEKFIFLNKNKKFKYLFDNLPQDVRNYIYADSGLYYPKYCLFFAYCTYRHGSNINFNKISIEFEEYSEKMSLENEKLIDVEDSLIEANIKKELIEIKKGDTIVLYSSLDFDNEIGYFSFWGKPFNKKDEIIIFGEFIDKSSINDNINRSIKMRVLTTSYNPSFYKNKELKFNNIIEFSLMGYKQKLDVKPLHRLSLSK